MYTHPQLLILPKYVTTIFIYDTTISTGRSGVRRSGDARDDCLIGCPPTKL